MRTAIADVVEELKTTVDPMRRLGIKKFLAVSQLSQISFRKSTNISSRLMFGRVGLCSTTPDLKGSYTLQLQSLVLFAMK